MLDLVGPHDFALRASLVGLVAAFFGLLHALEDRERTFLDPLADIALQVFVEAVVAMRTRMADVLDLQLALAEIALEREYRGVDASRETKSRA